MSLWRVSDLRSRLFVGIAGTVLVSLVVTVVAGALLTRRSLESTAVAALERELLVGETAIVVTHGVSGRVGATDLVGLDQDVSDAIFRGLDNCHWIELIEGRKSFSEQVRWRISGWNLGPWKA